MRRFLTRFVLIALSCLVLVLVLGRLGAVWRESGTAGLPPTAPGMIATQEGTLYTMSAGPPDGTPLLLAHGTAAWSGFWAPQVNELGTLGYRATAFDMPPFGYSQRAADRDYSRVRQAQRILALVDAMETRPILIAHSFGAAAATEAVLQNPDAFAGLIIVDGALSMSEAPQPATLPLPLRSRILRETAVSLTATNPWATKFFLRGLLYNKAAATDEVVESLQQPQNRPGTTSAYADWLPSLLAPETDALTRRAGNYADLPVPVRIIWGDRDTVTPPAQAEALAKALGQEPVLYLKDVGHIPHIEAPDAFMAALLNTLEGMVQAR